jgi:hypothetical protein
MRLILVCLVVISSSVGCASVATRPPPPGLQERPAEPGASLFPGDAATLDDREIARILGARFEPRARMRIALLYLEHRSMDVGWVYGPRQTASAQAPSSINEKLIGVLRGAAGVYDASYVPSFMSPTKLTVGNLREAAARYQADLLLLYRSECHTFEEYRVFRPSRAKAYCVAEAAAIDVRTGILPFTSRAVRDFEVVELSDDLALAEAVRRSEQLAVDGAMVENGQNLVKFLQATRASGAGS